MKTLAPSRRANIPIAFAVGLAHAIMLFGMALPGLPVGPVPMRRPSSVVHVLARTEVRPSATSDDAQASPAGSEAVRPRGASLPAARKAAAASPSSPATAQTPDVMADGPIASDRQLADDRFYLFEELDEPAQPMTSMDEGGGRWPAGAAKIALKIDRQGVVISVEVLEAQPVAFGDAMRNRLLGMRFQPALRNGLPVNSVKFVEFATSS